MISCGTAARGEMRCINQVKAGRIFKKINSEVIRPNNISENPEAYKEQYERSNNKTFIMSAICLRIMGANEKQCRYRHNKRYKKQNK